MDKNKPQDLPTFYYWDYFQFIINYIQKHYLSILSDEELHFLHLFQSLSFEAQCLLIRLGSRKPIWFHRKKIKYEEISSIEQSFAELHSVSLIQTIEEAPISSIELIIQELTKEQQFDLLKATSAQKGITKSSSKDAISQAILEVDASIVFSQLQGLFPDLVALQYQQEFDFFMFLFFGSKSRDLTDFVVKDLGFRQFFEIKEEDLIPYFTSREVAIEKWKISNWNESFYEGTKSQFNAYYWIESWKMDVLPLLPSLSDLSMGSFERSVYNLGRMLERQGYVEEALAIFEFGLGAKSLERRIRLLTKQKRTQEAMQWARVGLELFHHPNDRHFYLDYLAKDQPEKTIKQVTQKLKKAEVIELENEKGISVEQLVANYYQNKGFQAVFTENTLWKNVMGLLTWEIIFNASQHQFSHPFQYAPTQYRLEGFGLENLTHFHHKLAMLSDPKQLWSHFEWIKEKHHGTINPLIEWERLDFDLIRVLVERISVKSLSSVFEQLWINIATHCKGFPDLMVWNEYELFFVEVKSPNDHLSPIQYFWNEVINSSGIESKIIRIKWRKAD